MSIVDHILAKHASSGHELLRKPPVKVPEPFPDTEEMLPPGSTRQGVVAASLPKIAETLGRLKFFGAIGHTYVSL